MSSADLPSAIRIAQLVGITSGAWLSGNIATFSFAAVQGMVNAQQPTSSVVCIWQEVYHIGAKVNPFVALLPSGCFAYLAFDATSRTHNDAAFWLYTSAAVLVPCIAPYTIFIMKGTNSKLHRKADAVKAKSEATESDDKEVWPLLATWQWLNTVRGMIAGVGTLLGAWAALGGV